MSDVQVMIHVRFASDGSVREIGERPSGATPQEWFNQLARTAAAAYQVLSGGRGVFRLPRNELDAMKPSNGQHA